MIYHFDGDEYRYEFYIHNSYGITYIMIKACDKNCGGSITTGRRIENRKRKIVWQSELEDSGLHLTPEAKNFANKLVKLLAFA
jgi:hypothetical protein